VIATKCLTAYPDEHCAWDEAHYGDYNYTDLMNTTFGLAPRGWGISSYRIVELLAVNAIPIILQDASLLPFSEFLDWTEFALLVPERSTEAIPHMVRSMSPAKIRRMQAHGREVFLRYFRDEETMVLTLVEVIKARMRQVAATRQAGRGPGAGR
jgi:hypothetical protein